MGPRLGGPALRASVVAAALTLIVAAGTAEAAPASPAPTAPPPGPGGDLPANRVWGVSALSPTDAWAVGSRSTKAGTVATILQWTGKRWAKVPVPQPSRTKASLQSVDAVSTTDAWAVGSYVDDATGVERTLVLHWDGTSWSQVPSPSRGPQVSVLWSVSADSATDAWAIGNEGNGRHSFGFALHWDGTRWSRVATPQPSDAVTLRGVTAISPTDAWAVGGFQNNETFAFESLVLHWNGTAWSEVEHPNPGSMDTYLWGASATSSEDVWAVGDYYTAARGNDHTLVLHWNGKRWSKVRSPNPSPTLSSLLAVDAESPSDVWAVGSAGYVHDHAESVRTITLHWDGTSWSQIPAPDPSPVDNELFGVSATSSDDAWTVGYEQSGRGIDITLAMHWDGASWSQVASPDVLR